jgi:DNA processing protein
MNRFEISRDDGAYPPALQSTADPPEVLYGIGDPSILVTPGLAVIGARRATPYGLKCASIFGGWAAGVGVPVISGAALGCDQAAHRAAIDSDGATVAVLGCGADLDYPVRASSLLAQIRRDGVVVSELPWGAQPKRWTFARRNRIIAGLARAVLVVEASLPSGTFSTADRALEAGRDVFAVPGSVFAPECRGANRLIRQGASPIVDVDDLAHELGVAPSGSQPRDVGTDPILRAALADPARPDDLAHDLGMSIIEVARAVSRHEREGALVKYTDGRYGPG